ncbi:MAG: O-antigen ligase family protein [bacterium]
MSKTNKVLNLSIYFVVLFMPVIFFQKCEDAYYLPKLLALSFAVLNAGFVLVNINKIKLDRTDIVLFLFMAIYLTGCFRSLNKTEAFISFIEWPLCAGAYIYVKNFFSQKELEKTLLLACVSSFVVSGYALLQVFKIDLPGWLTDFNGRAFSSFGNPDFFGAFALLGIAFAFFLGSVTRYKKIAVVSGSTTAFALILSQTRSAFAGGIIFLVIMAVFLRKKVVKNYKLIVILLVVLVGLTVISGKIGNITARLRQAGEIGNTELSGRVQMWKAGLAAIKANPFIGIGLNNIKPFYAVYGGGTGEKYFETDRLHNDYINVAVESGIFAGLLFVLFLGGLMYELFRHKTIQSKIVFSVFAGIIVLAFFNFPFYIPAVKFYFFIMAGLALRNSEGIVFEPPFKTALLFVFFLLFGFLAINTMGSAYLNAGINASLSGNQKVAKTLLLKTNNYFGEKKYYYLAETANALGEGKTAGTYIDKFLQAQPFAKAALARAAFYRAQARDWDKALNELNKFLAYYPDDTDTLNNKGLLLYYKKELTQAVSIYIKVLSLEPGNLTAHENLCAIYKNNKMHKELSVEMERFARNKKSGTKF